MTSTHTSPAALAKTLGVAEDDVLVLVDQISQDEDLYTEEGLTAAGVEVITEQLTTPRPVSIATIAEITGTPVGSWEIPSTSVVMLHHDGTVQANDAVGVIDLTAGNDGLREILRGGTSAVAYQHSSPTEGARWITDGTTAQRIENEDPSLIVWL